MSGAQVSDGSDSVSRAICCQEFQGTCVQRTMSHPTPRMTVDNWSRGTQDCGNILEKFFQNSTVFIEKYEVYKCLMGLWLLRIWCDLVENSREHVCSAMTVNNWSRGNIAEQFFQNSTGCLAVLGNSVQYFEYMTAIIDLHCLTNIVTLGLVLRSFQAMKNAEPQFQFERKAGIHHYIKHS